MDVGVYENMLNVLTASVLSCFTLDTVQLCQNSYRHYDVSHLAMSGSAVTVPIEITDLGVSVCGLFSYKLMS